jgi:hypothetical protein
MEKIENPREKGLSKNQLLFWGLIFLLAGMISRGLLQIRVLQIGGLTGMQLLQLLSCSGSAMATATAALVMQALETCAIPIFAFFLVEGYEKSQSRKKLLLYLLITAAASEIPYNYVMAGTFLHTASRNPVIAMLIGVAVLYFFHRYSEKSFKNVLVRSAIGIAAVLWTVMLNVDHGPALLIVMMVMWTLRKKKHMLSLVGGVAAAACMLISPFYIVSIMGILPVHLCREETSEEMKIFPYLSYPVLLLAVCLLSNFI